MREQGKKTREKILSVATQLFGRYGFAGTSMDDIAERVGIKKASLYHHFPSKQDIYNELIDRTFNEIIDIFQMSFSSGDIVRDSKKFIRRIMDFISQNDVYVRILVRELLDENIPIRKLAREYVPKILEFGSKILEKGWSEGKIRKDIDPIQLSITTTGAILTYFLFEPLIEPFIKNPRSKKAIDERVAHIIDVFFHGILLDGEKKKNSSSG